MLKWDWLKKKYFDKIDEKKNVCENFPCGFLFHKNRRQKNNEQ